MRAIPRGLVPFFVAALATTAAGFGLYGELTQDPTAIQTLPQRDGVQEIERLAALPTLDPPPLDAFSTVLEKPLFSPTRRPPEAVEEQAAPVAAKRNPKPPPELRARLLGVVVSDSKNLAILKLPDEPAAVHVTKGDEVLGWTLTDIGPDSAQFERNGETVTLNLVYAP